MTQTTGQTIIDALVREHGRLFSEEVGVDVSDGSPEALFWALVTAVLARPPTELDVGIRSARSLRSAGYRDAYDLVRGGRDAVADVLRGEGLERAGDDVAGTLVDLATEVHERYQGDLRRVRDEALSDPVREREIVMRLPGVGATTADLFFSEVQIVWDEAAPFAPSDALLAARSLDVAVRLDDLVRFVEDDDLHRLVVALIRTQRDDLYSDVLAEARRGRKGGYTKDL